MPANHNAMAPTPPQLPSQWANLAPTLVAGLLLAIVVHLAGQQLEQTRLNEKMSTTLSTTVKTLDDVCNQIKELRTRQNIDDQKNALQDERIKQLERAVGID
jgi:hypothetical protein